MTSTPRARAPAKKPKPTKPRAASKRKAVAKTKAVRLKPVAQAASTPVPEPAPPTPGPATLAEPSAIVSVPATPTEPSVKGRKRGLGALSKHALSPVNATLNLVTKPIAQPSQALSGRPPTAIPEDAVHYLRAELTSLLAVLEDGTP